MAESSPTNSDEVEDDSRKEEESGTESQKEGQPEYDRKGHPFIENWEAIWDGHESSPQTIAFQFRLSALIRHEPHAEVYQVEPLLYFTSDILAVKGFVMHGLRRNNYRRRKRTMDALDRRKVVPHIKQHGKIWVIYKTNQESSRSPGPSRPLKALVIEKDNSASTQPQLEKDASIPTRPRKRRRRNRAKPPTSVLAPVLPTWAHFLPQKEATVLPSGQTPTILLCPHCTTKLRMLRDDHQNQTDLPVASETWRRNAEKLAKWPERRPDHHLQRKGPSQEHHYPETVTRNLEILLPQLCRRSTMYLHPQVETWRVWARTFNREILEQGESQMSLHPDVCVGWIAGASGIDDLDLSSFNVHIRRRAQDQEILRCRRIVAVCISMELGCLINLLRDMDTQSNLLGSLSLSPTSDGLPAAHWRSLATSLADRWRQTWLEVTRGKWDDWVTCVADSTRDTNNISIIQMLEAWSQEDLGITWSIGHTTRVLATAFGRYKDTTMPLSVMGAGHNEADRIIRGASSDEVEEDEEDEEDNGDEDDDGDEVDAGHLGKVPNVVPNQLHGASNSVEEPCVGYRNEYSWVNASYESDSAPGAPFY